MTNAARNESSIELMGDSYLVRPTFNTVARIEGALNEGVISLGQKMARGEMSLSAMAIVLHHMAGSTGSRPPKVADIGEHLMETGLQQYVLPVSEFLLTAFQGRANMRSNEAVGEQPDET